MPFFGDLFDSLLPGVGHVKGIVHYACGDQEGGNKAMTSATRSAAVVGAVSVGTIDAGAAAYDTGTTAIVTDGEQVSGVAQIFQNPGEISSWVGAGVLNSALDSNKGTESTSSRQQNSTADDSSSQKSNGDDSRRGSSKGTSGDPADDRRDGSKDEKKECQGATTQQLEEFIRIVKVILEFVRNTHKHWRCLETINRYLQEFLEAAMPLMNDPTVRLTIRNGTLEMCIDGRVLISIEHHLASFLSLAIQQHSVGETSRIDYPCSQESCEYCPNLRHAQTEWTGNCQTRNVIYSFRCRDCHQMVYVGQTTRPLRLRMGQHLRNFNSALHRHIAGRPQHHTSARTKEGLLETFDIVIMWRKSDVDTTDLDHEDKIENIRNWEVLMQWLTMSHKSLGGESQR